MIASFEDMRGTRWWLPLILKFSDRIFRRKVKIDLGCSQPVVAKESHQGLMFSLNCNIASLTLSPVLQIFMNNRPIRVDNILSISYQLFLKLQSFGKAGRK